MRVTAVSTDKIVQVRTPDGAAVPARIWEATTAAGIRCRLFVTRVMVADTADVREFDRELEEHQAPSAETLSIPLRMIL